MKIFNDKIILTLPNKIDSEQTDSYFQLFKQSFTKKEQSVSSLHLSAGAGSSASSSFSHTAEFVLLYHQGGNPLSHQLSLKNTTEGFFQSVLTLDACQTWKSNKLQG